MSDVIRFKAGSFFYTSRGEYADFQIGPHFVALQDITQGDLLKIQKAIEDDLPDERKWDAADKFIPALIASGLVVGIDVKELHYADYEEIVL